MELKQVKELMAAMERTGTKRLVMKKEGIELELEREDNAAYKFVEPSYEFSEGSVLKNEIASRRAAMALSRGGELPVLINTPPATQEEDKKSVYITSPMVGTFYSSSSPGDPSFVKVGDRVEKDAVVCIIEAMKVMNEVKAGVSGVVAEVLVESGRPVEFSTKLFRIHS